MRMLAISLALSLAALPLRAEAPGDADRGFSLIEEGARLILRQMLDEVEPRMQDMQKGLSEASRQMGPALRGLMARIDDIRNYAPPEMLPNGDIIIRRKTPLVPAPGGEIDL